MLVKRVGTDRVCPPPKVRWSRQLVPARSRTLPLASQLGDGAGRDQILALAIVLLITALRLGTTSLLELHV